MAYRSLFNNLADNHRVLKSARRVDLGTYAFTERYPDTGLVVAQVNEMVPAELSDISELRGVRDLLETIENGHRVLEFMLTDLEPTRVSHDLSWEGDIVQLATTAQLLHTARDTAARAADLQGQYNVIHGPLR